MNDATPIRPPAPPSRPPAAFGLTWTAEQNEHTRVWSLNGYTPDGVLSFQLVTRLTNATLHPADVVRVIATLLGDVDPGQAELMAGVHFPPGGLR